MSSQIRSRVWKPHQEAAAISWQSSSHCWDHAWHTEWTVSKSKLEHSAAVCQENTKLALTMWSLLLCCLVGRTQLVFQKKGCENPLHSLI